MLYSASEEEKLEKNFLLCEDDAVPYLVPCVPNSVLTGPQLSPETHPLNFSISVVPPSTSLPFPSSHSGA